jgi:signal-transduction protein with cAMP-binding, CBS, and nucleotidyltransferase domain
MQEGQVRHLPVVTRGEIAGMVSMRDLFATLVDTTDQDVVPIVD